MKSYLPYSAHCDFPIENLPYGVFSSRMNPVPRIGVAISNMVLDLSEISHLFTGPELRNYQHVFRESTLNSFMALSPMAWREARATLQVLLSKENLSLQSNRELRNRAFITQLEVRMHLPVKIGDFTTFCSYSEHARKFRQMMGTKEDSSLPNWKTVPIGYHGRTSSIVISGTPVRRPRGMVSDQEGAPPRFGPSEKMDYEAEMGFFIGGRSSKVGEPIPISEAHDYIFGYVMVNNWTARDIQKFEHKPMGSFASKNMCTSISPWVVTPIALEPFRARNIHQDPPPMAYLNHPEPCNYNINIQVDLTPMRGTISTTVARTNYGFMYWNPKQQIAQHTISGCNLNIGDLISSGPMSGIEESSSCSIMELSHNGTQPVILFDGSQRCFLEDGDTVSMRAVARGPGFNIGFGSCIGVLEPAR